MSKLCELVFVDLPWAVCSFLACDWLCSAIF